MFDGFSFDNLLKPDNMMMGGGMLANMGQGLAQGKGLLGGMGQVAGGGMMGMLQNKQLMEMLKKLMQQGGGLGQQMGGGMGLGGLGSGPLAPWGGGQY